MLCVGKMLNSNKSVCCFCL